MTPTRRSKDSVYETIRNPRMRDLVKGSALNRLLARCEAKKTQRRGIPIVLTIDGLRVKGLPSNIAEIPVVGATVGRLQVKPGWVATTDAEAAALWRWRYHVARAA